MEQVTSEELAELRKAAAERDRLRADIDRIAEILNGLGPESGGGFGALAAIGLVVTEVTGKGLNPSLVPPSPWVPVADRLPEKGVPVLITGAYGVMMAKFWGGGWDDGQTNLYGDAVTHWMPLPAIPKE